MNFLCAKEMNGEFIVRIEDTDQKRSEAHFLEKIYSTLRVMNIHADEDEQIGGPFAPYTQSKRTHIYEKYLSLLKEKELVYRCFKTEEQLQEEQQKQRLLKQPPRYTRATLTNKEEEHFLSIKKPFIWRLHIKNAKTTIYDKEKGLVEYDLFHFADCPITRSDNSFTFLFANFVDDVEMKISYVIRGEEHLSNTAIQSYLYDILALEKPTYYHLPLLCDSEGKKLSKRNFGFNVDNLLEEGYLPEAIINYIATIGGKFEQEILSLEEMISSKLFSNNHGKGMITYDHTKLLWFNTKWIEKVTLNKFKEHLTYYSNITKRLFINLYDNIFIDQLRKESKTLTEFFFHYDSFFNTSEIIILNKDEEKNVEFFFHYICSKDYNSLIEFLPILKQYTIENNIPEKKYYMLIRKIITNREQGLSIRILLQFLSKDIAIRKIKNIQFI